MDPRDPRHPSKHGNDVVEPATQAEVNRRRDAQAGQTDELLGTPTTPALPSSMGKGMFAGAGIGAVVGALLLTPLAFANILDLDFFVRLVIVWVAGAAAGATIGAVFFAGAKAEMDNPENDEYLYADGPSDDRRQGPGLD